MIELGKVDTLTLRRVANGWIIAAGGGTVTELTHIASTPAELAKHVEAWAAEQFKMAKVIHG